MYLSVVLYELTGCVVKCEVLFLACSGGDLQLYLRTLWLGISCGMF